MPRYFFDTDDGDHVHQDTTGHELPDAVAARTAALDSLPDMAREHKGVVVYRATLKLDGERGPGFAKAS